MSKKGDEFTRGLSDLLRLPREKKRHTIPWANYQPDGKKVCPKCGLEVKEGSRGWLHVREKGKMTEQEAPRKGYRCTRCGENCYECYCVIRWHIYCLSCRDILKNQECSEPSGAAPAAAKVLAEMNREREARRK
jgi:hypothetical protein